MTTPNHFAINDRVRVSGNAPMLKNLAGREGTVINFLGGSGLLGPDMIEVRIDNLTSVPMVPFYASELIKISKENPDG